MTRLLAIALSVSQLLAACADAAPRAGATAGDDCGAAPAGLTAATVRSAVRTLATGSADGVAGDAFGRIVGVAVGDRGSVFALDAQERQVIVIDSAGTVVSRFGRRGDGPGEFIAPVGIAVHGGRVRVFDASSWRVSEFSASGELLGTHAPPRQGQFGQVPEVRFAGDGSLYQLGYERYQSSLEAEIGMRRRGLVRGRNTIDRWSPGEPVWTSLAEVPGLEVHVDMDEGDIQDVPFAGRALWALDRAGQLWYADSRTDEIRLARRDGGAGCVIRLGRDAARVTRAESDAYYAGQDLAHLGADRVLAARARRQGVAIPATRPVLRALDAAGAGGIVVALEPRAPDPDRVEWALVAEDGTVRARVMLPARFTPHVWVDDRRVVGVEADELGVHSVAWYGLRAR